MVFTQITLTIEGAQGIVLNQYQKGSSLAQAVDSDADKDIVAIDVRGVSEAGLQLINKHAANGLTYTIYGTVIDTIPTSYLAEEWEEAVAATALAIDTSKVETVTTKAYSYLLIRAKRTVSTNDSTLDIHYRGEK